MTVNRRMLCPLSILRFPILPHINIFSSLTMISTCLLCSAASNIHTGEGVAIKKVTNVFSKKILAKRALREIKLLQHFRGHRNVSSYLPTMYP